MTIREGTLVTRHDMTDGSNPCEMYVDWERHSEADTDGILDVCIGMVIEAMDGKTDVTVNWLQMCPYHHNNGPNLQEAINYNLLWEVGQLR